MLSFSSVLLSFSSTTMRVFICFLNNITDFLLPPSFKISFLFNFGSSMWCLWIVCMYRKLKCEWGGWLDSEGRYLSLPLWLALCILLPLWLMTHSFKENELGNAAHYFALIFDLFSLSRKLIKANYYYLFPIPFITNHGEVCLVMGRNGFDTIIVAIIIISQLIVLTLRVFYYSSVSSPIINAIFSFCETLDSSTFWKSHHDS